MTKPKTYTDAQIPEAWKSTNFGPYRKAPAEYGGEWWYVSPFTGSKPWERFGFQPTPVTLPDGFERIFGEEPQFADYRDSVAWRVARDQWRLDLERFKGAGRPLWLSAEQKADLDALYQSWGMGHPHFYGGRYGEMARWPDSQIQDFQDSAYAAANYPHHTIARYQAALADIGVIVPEGERHPFVPGWVFGEGEDGAED